MSLLSTIKADIDALKSRIEAAFATPAGQQIETTVGDALDKALDDFIVSELAALGVETAGLSTATLPTLLGTLGATLISTLAAKLTVHLAGSPTATSAEPTEPAEPAAPTTPAAPAA